jgi:hypothetical protein
VSEAAARSVQSAPWLDDATTAPVVAVLAEAVAYYEELKSDPKTRPRGRLSALAAVGDLVDTLGLSPTSRSRLGLGEVRR